MKIFSFLIFIFCLIPFSIFPVSLIKNDLELNRPAASISLGSSAISKLDSNFFFEQAASLDPSVEFNVKLFHHRFEKANHLGFVMQTRYHEFLSAFSYRQYSIDAQSVNENIFGYLEPGFIKSNAIKREFRGGLSADHLFEDFRIGSQIALSQNSLFSSQSSWAIFIDSGLIYKYDDLTSFAFSLRNFFIKPFSWSSGRTEKYPFAYQLGSHRYLFNETLAIYASLYHDIYVSKLLFGVDYTPFSFLNLRMGKSTHHWNLGVGFHLDRIATDLNYTFLKDSEKHFIHTPFRFTFTYVLKRLVKEPNSQNKDDNIQFQPKEFQGDENLAHVYLDINPNVAPEVLKSLKESFRLPNTELFYINQTINKVFFARLLADFFQLSSPLYQIPIDDLDPSSENFDAVERVIYAEIFSLNEGKFNINNFNKVVAFVALIKALDVELIRPEASTFKDIPMTHWAFTYIETGVSLGIIQKNDFFDPSKQLRNGDVLKWLINIEKQKLAPLMDTNHTQNKNSTEE